MKYQVKTVAKFAGVTGHTLRAWERRYSAVMPERDNRNGRRLYSESDAHRLRLLAELVRQGHSIGRIADEQTRVLERMLRSANLGDATPQDEGIWQEMYQRVVEGLKKFDFDRLYNSLRALRAQRFVEDYLLSVCAPLLRMVGTLVSEGKLTVAHEHVLSAIIKMELFDIFASSPTTVNPTRESFMFTTTEGDYHEIGILIAATLAKLRGRRVHYLGPSMPVDALVKASSMAKVDAIVLGFVPQLGVEIGVDPQTYLEDLHEKLPPKVAILTGGLDQHRVDQQIFAGRRTWKNLRDLQEYFSLLQDEKGEGNRSMVSQ